MGTFVEEGIADSDDELFLLGEEIEKNVLPLEAQTRVPALRLVLRGVSTGPPGSKRLIKQDDWVSGFYLIPTGRKRSDKYKSKVLSQHEADVPLPKKPVSLADDALLSFVMEPVGNQMRLTEMKTEERGELIPFPLFGTGTSAEIVKDQKPTDTAERFVVEAIFKKMEEERQNEGELERETERGLFELPGHIRDVQQGWDSEAFLAEQMRMFGKDLAAYETIDEEAKKQHHGEYVAIIYGDVFGFSPDEGSLRTRVHKERGSVDVLIKQVGVPDEVRYGPRVRGK